VCRDLSIAKAAGKPSCSSFTGFELVRLGWASWVGRSGLAAMT